MEALHYDEHYTRADYARWEGDWELIYGHPYAMSPAPTTTHQGLSLQIAMQLYRKIEESGCEDCKVFQDVDYEVSEDTVVRPDVLLICKPVGEVVNKVPEIIFEIISPATGRRDETIKFELYQKEGVGYYVLVYPDGQVAKVYRCNELGKYVKVGDFDNETIEFETKKCRFDFDFSKIWRQ
ncbi:Uma2 family endonuclease [Hydrogenimonas cancrithermarum]|uniref:Putative restriction endonuclease domain-containing protein n=1 Tax=Hydrogenimonas cancrithermarum TaxID=2993563 RepID=A0ABM8FLT7_9BACT|nr:Uma2 family endonuclease [Hydrogenimonas cancrithermarum]BDY12667.1 hypothetical protein HCR_09790 [Hydrogenimonas cancrithermarum]